MATYQFEIDGAKYQADLPDVKGSPTTQVETGPAVSDSTQNGFDWTSMAGSARNLSTDTRKSSELTGIPAVAVEFGRGLEKGTGQVVADVGWLGNVGGIVKNPVGSKIQEFGNTLIQKANEIPETDLPGWVKGTANIAGEAAPMLATFAGAEVMGAAKLGEGGVKLIGAASKSPKVAHYLNMLVRPMGQATLFGLTNAVDTASTLPETTNFNDRVNEVYRSGKEGFIAGALFTPLMDKALEVVSKHGVNAGKAVIVGMTGSPQLADQALDLTRKQGTYGRIKVDPTKPVDLRLSLETTEAREFSPAQREEIHKQLMQRQQAEIESIQKSHEQTKYDLERNIDEANHQYKIAESQTKNDLDNRYEIQKQAQEAQINGNIAQIGEKKTAQLDAFESANLQKLNQVPSALVQYIDDKATQLTQTRDMLHASVINSDPVGGFSSEGIIGKIKKWLGDRYGVTLTQESPKVSYKGGQVVAEDLPPNLAKEMTSNRPPVWKASSTDPARLKDPELAKVLPYLTKKGGFLDDLQKVAGSNDKKLSLEMLQTRIRNLDGLTYDKVTGVVDKGLSQLREEINPTNLVGNIMNPNDVGQWLGQKESLASLKEASLHTSAIKQLLDAKESIAKEFVSNKEFLDNASTKVKSLLNNPGGYKNLRSLEDSLHLDSRSPLRLTNAFEDYAKTLDGINRKRSLLKEAMSSAIRNQKSKLSAELNALKQGEITDIANKRYANKEAMIQKKRNEVLSKATDLDKATKFRDKLSDQIKLENLNRQAALNEVATIGSYSTAIGKVQRGFLLGGASSLLYGSPHGIISSAVGIALMPRTAISIGRSLKAFMQSNTGKAMAQGMLTTTTNKSFQRMVIGNLLKSNRNSTNYN